MIILYNFLIQLALIFLRLISLFNKEAKNLLNGQKNTKLKLDSFINHSNDNIVWFHCASLGEFELSKPLIQKIKSNHSESRIILTFFSPSGYEICKNYILADLVCYLPFDTPGKTRYFISKTKPSVAFFVKYEFWPNYLYLLKQNAIPVFSISSRFNKNQFIFKIYGKWLLNIIKSIDHFFVQDKSSVKLLYTNNIKNVTLSGDLRMDRVIDVASSDEDFYKIKKFIDGEKCFIAGSTWLEDYKIILPKINISDSIKTIIAPHKVDLQSINTLIENLDKSYVLLSSLESSLDYKKNILIIDTIGMLSKIYKYAHFAYVGGGMGKDGLHNILEPAVHGLPIIIGRNYLKFNEAIDLISVGGVKSVNSSISFGILFDELSLNSELSNKMGKTNQEYVYKNKGATALVYSKIKKYL